MTIQVSWYVEPRIVLLTTGNRPARLADIEQLNEAMLAYLARGSAPVHMLFTISAGMMLPLNFGAMLEHSTYVQHPAMGIAVLVRQQRRLPVMEYMVDMLVRLSRVQFYAAAGWADAHTYLLAHDATLAQVTFPLHPPVDITPHNT